MSTFIVQPVEDDDGSQDELPSLDEATQSVDALVSDEPQPVFSAPAIGSEMTVGRYIPLGFTFPQSVANPLVNSPRSSMASPILGQLRQPHIVASLPKLPNPQGLARGTVTPEQTPTKMTPASANFGRTNRSVAIEATGSRHIPSQRHVARKQSLTSLQDEDFPALVSYQAGNNRPAPSVMLVVPSPKLTPAPKKGGDKAVDKRARGMYGNPSSPVAVSTKKVHTSVSSKAVASEDTPSKEKIDRAAEISSALSALSALPSFTTNSPSPAPRNAPRTLRVMSTPKSTDASALRSPMQTVANKAVFASHGPDTPLSGMTSDTASILSASVSASRASSPLPSKVGSAAVRNTTRSQQRKQRKDASKQEAKSIAETLKADPEEHAPVIGRKKKQKKERPSNSTARQSKLSDAAAPESEQAKPETASRSAKSEQVEPKSKTAKEKKGVRRKDRDKEVNKKKEEDEGDGGDEEDEEDEGGDEERDEEGSKNEPRKSVLTVSPQQTQAPGTFPFEPIESADPVERQQFGPASVFAEIRDSLWTSALDKLQILKPVSNTSSRPERGPAANAATQSGYCKECACKCGEIQDGDLIALRAGKPVRKQFHLDGSRMLITPNGDCIRGLTPEEEDAFLDLQSAVAATADNPGAFVAPRHQPGSGAFSLIKGRAVPNGRPNIFPATAQPHSQDPIGKLQREDALSYINQYVLPRLNLDAANMGFPKGASPLRDAAAASLNALAPYFYGPDAAAGVGIYSAPDGARAMQDFSSSGGAPAADVSKIGPANGLGGICLMSVEDAEVRLAASRRETEKLEKGLNAVIKRNRRLLMGGGN